MHQNHECVFGTTHARVNLAKRGVQIYQEKKTTQVPITSAFDPDYLDKMFQKY